MANPFTTVQVRKPQSSTFDLSHDVKLSTKMGQLTPILVQECIPGDKFNISSESLIRFAPLVAPVMHNIQVYIHYFFVPNRLTWPNWENFITDNGGTPPAPPTIEVGINEPIGSLADYLGIPTGIDIPAGEISALPFAAYQKIYNEYYRDQNLIGPVLDELTDGATNYGMEGDFLQLRKRAWQHDYFTSALPFAQKGEAVSLPTFSFDDVPILRNQNNPNSADISLAAPVPGTIVGVPQQETTSTGINSGGFYANTSELNANAATINDLRRAFRLQEWLEKMARGGSRYIEQTLMHFGVRSSDSRLNRPEYIGGNRQPVVISEVLQTSDSGGQETPLASMGGHGLSASSGKNSSYRCEEHGYIIGIMSIMPNTTYQQGLPRHFSRKSHLDYAWPTFAHIGEQEIKNKELYFSNDEAYNEGTFGYIPRYSEYRYQPSRVAGEFKTTLNYWHLGRIFGNKPVLNSDFVECKPRTDIFAVQSEAFDQNIWCHIHNRVSANRRLPQYGTPTL